MGASKRPRFFGQSHRSARVSGVGRNLKNLTISCPKPAAFVHCCLGAVIVSCHFVSFKEQSRITFSELHPTAQDRAMDECKPTYEVLEARLHKLEAVVQECERLSVANRYAAP